MENDGFLPKTYVFICDESLEVYIDASSYSMHMRNNAVNTWTTIKNADLIGQVIKDGEVVFSYNYGFLVLSQTSYGSCCL